MKGRMASMGKLSLATLLSLSLGLFLTPSAAFATGDQEGALENEIAELGEGAQRDFDSSSAAKVDCSLLEDAIRSATSGVGIADTGVFSVSGAAEASIAMDKDSVYGPSEYYLEKGLGKIDSWSGDGSIHGTVMHFSLSVGSFVTIETDVYNVDSVLMSLNTPDGEMLETWAPDDGSVYGVFALPAGDYYLEFLSTSDGFSSVGAKYDAETLDWDEPVVFEREDNAPDEGEPVSSASNRIPLDTWVAGSFYRLPALVDLDYFTFEVSVAGHYQFSLAATDSMLFGMVDEDASSLNAAQIPKGGGSAVLDLGYLQPGIYNLCVTSADIEAAGSIYNGMVSRVDGDEPSSGWSKWGSLEWQIADNCLSIRPADGAAEGYVESGNAPWFGEQTAEVTKVSIAGTVKLGAGVNIASLFSNSMKLTEIEGLGNLDTSEVVDMSSMFRNCSSLASIDLSGLETDSLTNMNSMFWGCFALESIDLSPLDTSEVVDLSYLFAYCSSLTQVVISDDFIGGKCITVDGMFQNCNAMDTVPSNYSFGSNDSLSKVGVFAYSGEDPAVQTTYYAGDDAGVIGYDWASDGRSLTVVGEPEVPSNPFIDVFEVETPHYAHILWLAEQKISEGWLDESTATRSYRPWDNVARADMAAFLYRLAGSPDFVPTEQDLASFSDVDESTPHYKEICWLASAGISEGWDVDGGMREFRPYQSIARIDMAAFLHRLANWMGAANPEDAGRSFPDVGIDMPHAEDVVWLAAAGITTGFPDGTFQPYGSIVRCDMAAMLHRLDGFVEGYEVA